jgi:hypothetical protein
MQDYRLDYRVRTRCTQEIEASCASEKRMVDSKNASELFAKPAQTFYSFDQFADASSGLVLNCLKKNMTRLGSLCQEEMRRVIRVHAMHKRADPVFARDCEADISETCANVEPDSYKIHLCLRKNLAVISSKCKHAEITQGTLEAMDVGLKPVLASRCNSAIAEYCSAVNPGEAQVIHCLQDNINKPSFPARCKAAVEEDLEASNRDWRLKYGFEAHCSNDIRALCNDEMEAEGGLGEVLTCLKDKIKKVTSQPCQEQILRVTRQGASNIKLAPNQQEVCKDDVEKYCAGVTPGSGRVHDCLLRNRFSVQEACAAAEFKNRERQSQDLRANPKAMELCNVKELCGDVTFGSGSSHVNGGKMWACLEDKIEDPRMPQQCKSLVKSHMSTKHLEYHLNPRLQKYCDADAQALCKEEADIAGKKNFQSEGQLINCLIQNRKHVNNTDCVAMLERKVSQKITHTSLDADRASSCEADINEFCAAFKGRGQGLVHDCLDKHSAQLTEPCKEKQRHFAVMASEGINMNPVIGKRCQHAQKQFCDGVTASRGAGRIIRCLIDHIHAAEMDGYCRDALLQEQKKRASSLDFNPRLKTVCLKDLEALESAQKCDAGAEVYEENGHGRRYKCLVSNIKTLKDPDCKRLVREKLSWHSADLRAKPGMQKACQDDLNILCPKVSPGGHRWLTCLNTQLERIQSNECKKMVLEVKTHDSKYARVNFALRKYCANERKAFCKDVVPGGSRTLVCLKLKQDDPLVGESCKAALRKIEAPALARADSQNVIRFEGKLKDLQEWIEHNKGFIDKYGGVLLSGTIGFVSLLTFGISYWLFRRWRYGGKGTYSVVVPRDLEG